MSLDGTAAADQLRNAMVDSLRPWGAVLSSRVDAAMRAVPRHVFVPQVSLQRAYGPDPVVTHRDSDGVPEVTVLVDAVPVHAQRRRLPGADCGVAIDLSAVQELADLVAQGSVSAAKASAALHALGGEIDWYHNCGAAG
uniref:hypothetical protein n=1 Tax=Amycolatopsis sp. CA-096443 TaxID=3239919 RepID=UPI003F49A72C